MGCRVCFCMSPRAAARFVGILDLILGFVGIMFSSILLEFRNDDEPEGVSGSGNLTASSTSPSLTIRKTVTDNIPEAEKILWVMAVGLIFPAVLTLIVGITILISVAQNNLFVARMAYVLNIFLIVGAFAVYAILFILGYHWLDGTPILFWTLLQIIFLCAVQDFIRMDLGLESM